MQILAKSSKSLLWAWKIFQIIAPGLKNLPNPCSGLIKSSKSSLRDCSAAARLASGGSGPAGPAGAPKTLPNHGKSRKSTFNCTKYKQMGPNYFKVMFCISMHYFVMVSCTSMVPFQIYLSYFVEFWWRSIGCHTSRPLARPVHNQEISRKSKEIQWAPGWPAGRKPPRHLKSFEKKSRFYSICKDGSAELFRMLSYLCNVKQRYNLTL